MARSRDAAETSIIFYLNEIGNQEINSSSRPANKQRALVVDGKTLTFLLDPRYNCLNRRTVPNIHTIILYNSYLI